MQKPWMDIPPAQFFKGSPMLEVLDFLERLAPFSPPQLLVRDDAPKLAIAAPVGPPAPAPPPPPPVAIAGLLSRRHPRARTLVSAPYPSWHRRRDREPDDATYNN